MKRTGKFGVWQAILILFLIIIISMIVSFISHNLSITKEIGMFLSYLISFGLASYISIQIYKKYNGSFELDINFHYWKILPLVAILPILSAFGFTMHIANLIPMPEFMKELFREMAEANGIFPFLMIIVLAPIFEEFICRGVILKGFLEKYSVKKAIIISSLIFGIMHLNPWQFIGAFVMGLIGGWLFWKTKSLFLPIVVHFSNNLFFSLFGLYVSTDYLIDKPIRELFGDTSNQIIGISLAISLFCIIIVVIENYFRRTLTIK